MKTKKLRFAILFCALFALCMAFASSALAQEIPYTKVKLNKTKATITSTGKVQLKISKFTPSNANTGEWVSSNEDVCTVDETGLVTANSSLAKSSAATISFRSNDKTLATCKVTVKVVAVTSVKLSKTSFAMAPNKTTTLTATVSPSNAVKREVTWVSSDPNVVEVDQDGTIRSKNYGTATVRATTANGKFAKCVIKVADVPVSKVAIKLSSLKLKPYQTVTLTYSVTPALATDTSLTWTSTNDEIVSVENGVLTAKYDGSAKITAISNDGSKKKDSIRVTVVATRVKSFAFNKEYDTYLKKGASLKMETTVLPTNASFTTVEWSSSNESVITVDQNGNIKAVGGGTATITATVDRGKKKLTHKFYVFDDSGVTIKISAAGDVTLGGDPRVSKGDYVVSTYTTAARFRQLLEENGSDPAFVFKNVKSVFENDDLSIVNLECALTTTTGYSKSEKYVFRGHPSYATALSDSSIEAACIANNMSVCCGSTGYTNTKKAIETYCQGKTVWFDDSYDGEDACLIEKKGVTIGLIGFTQYKSNTYISNRIKKMRDKCDLLIVYIHWTKVHLTHVTNKAMKTTAHLAVDSGADLVLSSAQHYLAGIELYEGKTILYGLGNLVHGGAADRDTFIYQQSFTVYNDFSIPGDYNIVACATTDDKKNLNKWQPIILTDKTEIETVYSHLHSYSKSFAIPGI